MGVTDENKRADIMGARQLPEWAVAELGESGVERIHALDEIGTRGRSMVASDPARLAETMTTAHFDSYFADAISRAFYADYQYDVGSWVNYTYADTAPDFRDVARFRMSEPGTLYKRREKQHRQ